jgi:hypothetical protein
VHHKHESFAISAVDLASWLASRFAPCAKRRHLATRETSISIVLATKVKTLANIKLGIVFSHQSVP